MVSKLKKVKPRTKSFNCRNCGAPVEIKILGQTLNVVCPSCKSIIDATDPNFKILQEAVEKIKYKPYIPLGTRGKLHGVLWEVTGFIVKRDSSYYWQEYLLFNPYHGYRWLVESDGHFSLFKRIHSNPSSPGSYAGVEYRKQLFKLFNSGNALVEYVEGEFFWRVKRGNNTKVEDYIGPPFGLSLEKDKDEYTWTFGHHVERDSILRGFKLDTDALPNPQGVGSLQPSDFKDKLKKMLPILSWSLMLIFGIQLARMVQAQNEVVFEKSIRKKGTIRYPNRNKSFKNFKSKTFEIKGGKSNVMFKASAPLRNAWVYLDILLVDSVTQKGIPVPLEVSYFAGSDWSEGSRSSSEHIFNVPDGKYYLNVEVKEGGRRHTFNSVRLRVTRDVVMYSNFIYACLLVLIGPIFAFIRKNSFEVKRWRNSDYSPYE